MGLTAPRAPEMTGAPRAGTAAAPPPASPPAAAPGGEAGAALGCSVRSLPAPCRGWRGGWAEKGVIFKRLLSAQTVIAILCAVLGGWGSRGGLSQLPMSSHP